MIKLTREEEIGIFGYDYEGELDKLAEKQADRVAEKVSQVTDSFIRNATFLGHSVDELTDMAQNGKQLTFGDIQQLIIEEYAQLEKVRFEIGELLHRGVDMDEYIDALFSRGEDIRPDRSNDPEMLKLKARGYDIYNNISILETASPMPKE